MGLLAKIIQNEAKKFLKIDQAILIVKHLFRESYRTTWIYLSQNHVFGDLEVYEKGKNLSFNIIDKGGTFVEADDYVLSGGVDTTSYFPGSIHEKYWKKSDFLELESIRKIGITYEIIDHYLNYHYIKAGHDSFTPFKDIPSPNFDELPTQEPIGCGNPTIQQTEPTIENLNAEIARLKQEMVSKDQTIAELQQKNGSLVAENAINDIEISLKNSELLFIAVLLKKLQSAITTKRHKSQNAILESIETEYGVGSGLSKSTTDKIMKKANGIYKSLITNKMQ